MRIIYASAPIAAGDKAIQRDLPMFKDDVERRKYDTRLIAAREQGIYAYDIERDITPWESVPSVLPLVDGQQFDPGGRVVTAYAVPGHSCAKSTTGSTTVLEQG